MFLEILILLGIAIAATSLTLLGFVLYLSFQHWRMMKKLREDGFYD